MKKSSRKENSRNNSKWEKREKEKKNIQGPKGAGRDFVYSWKSVDHESGGLPTLPKRHVDVRIAGSFLSRTERRKHSARCSNPLPSETSGSRNIPFPRKDTILMNTVMIETIEGQGNND
jgi:hypothetical protein